MQTYSVYFSGTLADADIQAAKDKLAKAYDTSSSQFDAWFMGNEICVKQNAPLEEATTVQTFLADLGITTQIKDYVQGQHIDLTANNTGSSAQASDEIPAGFWIRFLAVIIDSFALLIPLFIVQLILAIILNPLIADIVGYIIGMVYVIWMTCSSWQGTLGKRALGLIVVGENGERISCARSIGRYFAQILSAIILMIGYIMAGFTDKKRSLHDKIAGTRVIYKKK